MSVTVKLRVEAVEVLQSANSLPEGEEIELFTASDLINLEHYRCEAIDLQMPACLRVDEDEDTGEMSHQ